LVGAAGRCLVVVMISLPLVVREMPIRHHPAFLFLRVVHRLLFVLLFFVVVGQALALLLLKRKVHPGARGEWEPGDVASPPRVENPKDPISSLVRTSRGALYPRGADQSNTAAAG
jgi:hypothetical protein